MKIALNSILNTGIDIHSENNSHLKKVRLLNGIAFFGGTFLLLVSIGIICIDYPYTHPFDMSKIGQLFFDKNSNSEIFESVKLIFPIVNILTSISLFLVLYLNRLHHFNASILTLYLAAIFSTFFSYFLRSNYAFFLTVIPSVVPILFYEKKKFQIPLYFLNYLLFIIATYIMDGYKVFYHNGENNVLFIYINMSVLYFFIFLVVNNLKVENRLSEERLQKQNDILKEQAIRIKAQSIELNNKNKELQTSLETVNNQKERIQEINETLEDANATKDKFFDIISHDLRSPFNSILGFSDILLENHAEYDNEFREKLIQQIVDSSKGAFKLVENLLEWSRAQTGKFSFNPEKIELEYVLNETLFDIENIAHNKNIEIRTQIPRGMTVYADKEILKTVLRNIASNAVKFTPKLGSIIIKAEIIDRSTLISVQDTGVGISKDKIEKIFDITQKTNTLGTDNESGTGLGLLFCKEFIEKHGGKIQIESEVGKGSIFSFSFPFEAVD
jgi:signal transduction histidine kinase